MPGPEHPARLYEHTAQTANDKIYRGSGWITKIIITDGGAAGGTLNFYDTDLAEGVSWASEKDLVPLLTIAASTQLTIIDFHGPALNTSRGVGIKASADDILCGVYISKRLQKGTNDPVLV